MVQQNAQSQKFVTEYLPRLCKIAPETVRDHYLPDEFRQKFHLTYMRRDTTFSAVSAILYPYDGRLAAHPAFFAAGEFRGQDQQHFDLIAGSHGKVSVEKNAIRT
jgi:hypothetical protein